MAVVKNLMVRCGADFSALSSGAKKGQKTVQVFQQNVAGSMDKVKSVFGKVAAAAAAAFSIGVIVSFGKESVQAATDMSNALQGLQSIMEGQGRSFAQAQKFIDGYVSDGLIPATQAITAYKNLALRGYDDSQIKQVMTSLKDSAAFGRQASYSLGEAVESATEGLKNENSILVDNAGVTKNVAKMWDDYAKSIGTTANNLTQQQKIQAEVAGILEESKYQVGDAAKVAGTFSGQLLKLGYNFNTLKVAVGNAIMPMAERVLPVVNSIVLALTSLAQRAVQVSSILFGKKISLAGTSEEAAEGQSDLKDAVQETSKAVKNSLAGFDELNVLQNETAETAGVAAAGILGGISGFSGEDVLNGTIGENLKLSANAENVLTGLKNIFNPDIWLDPSVKINMKQAKSSLDEALKNFGKALSPMLAGKSFDVGLFVNGMIKMSWNTPLDLAASLSKAVSGQLNIFSGMVKRDFDMTWKGIGQYISSQILIPSGFISTIADAFRGVNPAIQAALGSSFIFINPVAGGVVIGEAITKLILGENYDKAIQKARDILLPFAAEMQSLYEGLSPKTQNLLQPFIDGLAELDTKLKEMTWSQTVIKETLTIKTEIANLSNSVIEEFTRQKDDSLEQIQLLWEQGLITTQEEKDEMEARVRLLYENQVDTIKRGNDRIADILDQAKKENRAIKQSELEEITGIMEKLKADGIKIMASSEEEQKIISERIAQNAVGDSVYQSSEIIKNANQTRDDTIAAAQETRDKAITAIREQRDKGIIISDEEADRLIANAQRQYDESVRLANATRDGVVKAAEEQAGEHAKWIDTESGDVLSKWDRMWANMGESFKRWSFDTLKGIHDWWENVKSVFSSAWDAATNAWNNITNAFSNKKDDSTSSGSNSSPSFSMPVIPHLASGAVIPPGREFAAMLGDQTAGNNLELPEELLRQIVREEGGGTIEFTGADDIMQLVRLLQPKFVQESKRRGGNLIVGGNL